MLWAPRGARVEELQNVMHPPTGAEPLGSSARKQMWATWKDACKSMPCESSARLEASQDPGRSHREHESSGAQSRDGKWGGGGWKTNSRMLVLQFS